jgi:hypothetical protein
MRLSMSRRAACEIRVLEESGRRPRLKRPLATRTDDAARQRAVARQLSHQVTASASRAAPAACPAQAPNGSGLRGSSRCMSPRAGRDDADRRPRRGQAARGVGIRSSAQQQDSAMDFGTGTVTLTDMGSSPTPYLVVSGAADYRISCLVRPDRC